MIHDLQLEDFSTVSPCSLRQGWWTRKKGKRRRPLSRCGGAGSRDDKVEKTFWKEKAEYFLVLKKTGILGISNKESPLHLGKAYSHTACYSEYISCFFTLLVVPHVLMVPSAQAK